MPLVAPFRTSFGTETTREALLVRVVSADAEGWGECVAMSGPLYSSEYVDGAADVLRRYFVPALAAVENLDRDRRGGRPAQVQGPPDGQGRARARRARRGAARRGPAAGARARRGARPGRLRRVGRDHELRSRAARRGRGLPRRGLPADQAEDRAGLGRRAGRRGARTLRRRRAAAGRRQHRLHPRRRAAPGPARPVRPAAHRAAARRGGRARARRAGQAGAHPDLPRREHRLGEGGRRRDPARRLRDRQHQARAGRWLPRGPPRARRVPGQRRPGLVRRHARDGSRPSRQPGPRRAARVHPARRHVRLRALLPHRHHRALRACRTAIWRSRPGPASASTRSPTNWTRSPSARSGSRCTDGVVPMHRNRQ